ncbi:MAG: acetylornithine deacetylase [Pseudomonadales bacterium]|nr:acetylornithine deacetylase [Pseudomonadales bacterium]
MPKLIQNLQDLIALPSISSDNPKLDTSNRAVIDLLAERLADLGFAIDIQTVTDGSANGADSVNSKFNLIATLGGGSGGLVLAGHTDTVPFDDDKWQSDPFTLTDRDDRFYGLGTTDMKGFFAVALDAIESFCQTLGDKSKLKQPLILIATADEETSMAGAKALVAADTLQARYAVIGEPTGLKPVRMHKGVMMESISLEGCSGHSSNPALGNSALDAMHKVIGELMALRESWGRQYQNPAFEVILPTLNLASIHGGDAPNRICQHCELRFDVRLLPGMQNDDVRHSIRTRVESALAGSQIIAKHSSLFDGVSAFLEPETSELVRFAEKLSGHNAISAGFATEAPFMQAMGMQTIVMGPGSIDCAHQANEYLAQDQIKPGIDLLKSLIQQYCL